MLGTTCRTTVGCAADIQVAPLASRLDQALAFESEHLFATVGGTRWHAMLSRFCQSHCASSGCSSRSLVMVTLTHHKISLAESCYAPANSQRTRHGNLCHQTVSSPRCCQEILLGKASRSINAAGATGCSKGRKAEQGLLQRDVQNLTWKK